jgi:hypothetical protein
LEHPNIAGVQAYHNAGGMILRPPGAKYIKSYPRADVSVYDHIGREGEKILPFYRYMIIGKDLYPVHGGFVNWTFEHLGIFSFTNELWTADKMFYRSSKSGYFGRAEDRIKYDDLLLFGQLFKDWKPFKHPTYGEIELGGWVKFGSRVPPGFMLQEVCHRNAAFTIFHAMAMPKLSFADVRVQHKGDDVYELTVEVKNEHLIPTTAAIAAERKIGARDAAEIRPIGEPKVEVLAGGTLADRFLAPLEFVEHQPWRIWNAGGIRGERTQLFRWILKGPGRVQVSYRSQKAKPITTTIDLTDGES